MKIAFKPKPTSETEFSCCFSYTDGDITGKLV